WSGRPGGQRYSIGIVSMTDAVPSPPPLAGKIAVVTGASRGIGRAIARQLAHDGAAVMLAARDEAALSAVAQEITQAGGRAAACALDLRQPDAPGRLVEAAVQAFGGLDIVVNNAGATKRGAFLKLAEEDWADGFALKFFGAVRLTRAAWPHLRARGGSVVNVVGSGGRTPGAEFAVGGSVNAALLSLTKALAELGIQDGVQVNAVNPGPVRTERLAARLQTAAHDQGVGVEEAAAQMVKYARITRLGEPEDIAYLVAFLVSPRGRLMQGSLIDIDGGLTKTI
ncbi:MAG TPA: SDR family oxidoreductase, partial [Gemmataceae bacterium]|nr:SDR family oxidoreductase [Gemmataceae bacterium]